jgi:hypothetical protein
VYLTNLAESLVDPGRDLVLEEAENELAAATGNDHQADLYAVIKAIEHFDQHQLDIAVPPLKTLFQKLANADKVLQQHSDALEGIKKTWQSAADAAKQELRAWQRWALNEEQARIERHWARPRRPWFCYAPNARFVGGATIFESPERLEYQYAYFEYLVSAIDTAIAESRIEGRLPLHLHVRQFRSTMKALEQNHRQFQTMSRKEQHALEEWNALWSEYEVKMTPLNRMVWQMPETARRALFRLCRPELFESAMA